jgi:7-cyano-7-deazaguanine synthase in queuosine biosynthesis
MSVLGEELLQFREKLRFKEMMVGISGGKDSTVTAHCLLEYGFKPLAFTFDIGYYPEHVFGRAAEVACKMGLRHEVIGIQRHIRDLDRECYRLTAELYDDPHNFRTLYAESRQHYSIKSTHVIPFVRPCQLCRRTVIRAYYAEAVKRGIEVVVLGMNEWAGLSDNRFQAIRKLQPTSDSPIVYVIHLPFILSMNVGEVATKLLELGWQIPENEALIETNANSCLFALATETIAHQQLGFHPDEPRLSREVTAGFIKRQQALQALERVHHSHMSVRQVLERANLL